MKTMKRAAAFTLAAVLCVPLAAGAQENDAIAGSVTTALKASHAPGVSVAIMEHGKIVFDRGFGVKNLDSGAPVDAHTRFEIGSITKQFTAAAILQLKERGKLSLSDRLGKYVPQYPAAKDVTIEQLLWQVSGIPDYTEAKDFVRVATSRPGTLDSVLALVKNKPLEFKPGTRWKYSNTNYFLLGRVVETASGMPWQKYVRTHIFSPANMTESTFMEDERSVADMATGYEMKKNSLVPSPPFGGWAYSAGAIVSTAGDLLKWDRALFGGKIVSTSDLQLMTRPGILVNGEPTNYGFGWMIDSHDGTPRVWHNGGTFGFTAENEVYPKLGQAIVALDNSSAAVPETITGDVFAALDPRLAASENTAAAGEDPAVTARAKSTFESFLNEKPDRSQLTPQMSKALTPENLASVAAQVKQLGVAQTWVFRGKKIEGDQTSYQYLVTFSTGTKLLLTMTVDAAGKISGYFLSPG